MGMAKEKNKWGECRRDMNNKTDKMEGLLGKPIKSGYPLSPGGLFSYGSPGSARIQVSAWHVV